MIDINHEEYQEFGVIKGYFGEFMARQAVKLAYLHWGKQPPKGYWKSPQFRKLYEEVYGRELDIIIVVPDGCRE